MNSWERLENGSRYDAVKTGAVTSIELKAFREADGRDEFEELVKERRAVSDQAEYKERHRRQRNR